MSKILIAVDAAAPAHTATALEEAVRLHTVSPVTVHLLSVQPLLSGHASMFLAPGALRQMQQAAGEEGLAEAQAVLARSQVPFTSSVRIGRSAETIAAAAREFGCDRILLDHDRDGGLAGVILGSLVQQVREIVGTTGGACQVSAY